MSPLSAQDWRRVETLLDAVLDGADGAAPGGDLEVHAEVERLLGYREHVCDFLESPAHEFAASLLAVEAQAADAITPERIGPYRILSEAGRGGMATVYLAEREDPLLQQRVAIKVLHEAIASRSLVRRFIHERQILASLDHPGIAQLFDGGITDEGLPWFAMEYVDGEPILRYCEKRRLDVEARLELFLRVCDAVQYAHRNLVVHRDLKPSNILVAEPVVAGTPGRVKLLDFGIARLLSPDPVGGPGLTRTAMLPMTPEYASPEQLRGESVSTSSDVYQLGVLLYELLAGVRPFRLAGLPLHEAQRILLEEKPASASSVVVRKADGSEGLAGAARAPTPETVARDRASRPDRLRRRLRGDLDNILLMALRNSPGQRYASVERFADDVRRHLNAEPVSARPDTLRYRAAKFVRRHRVGVVATALTFLLVTVLAASMSLQAGRIARERDRAEQVTAFLVDLFEAFEPLEARGVTVKVPEVLRHGVDRARVELANRPLLRATILDAIAGVYELQGLHEMAEPLLEEALAARLAALGPAHLDVAHSRRRLAELRYERGNYRTESLYRAALATYRDRLDPEHVDIIRTEIGLALLLRARGSYAAADSMLRQSLLRARGRDELSLDVPIMLLFLGKLRTRAADYEEAERLIRESLALRRSLLGEDHPAVANALDALGEIMLDRGDFATGEALFEQALAIRYRLYEGDHTDIASGLAYLARTRLEMADLRAADTLLLRALPIFRRAFGEGSADFAEALEHLGVTRMASGDLESADSLFAQALAIWRAKPIEPTHDRPATLLVRMGELRMARHDAEAARLLLTEGLALREASLPRGHWRIAEAKSLLGASLSMLGRFTEAELLLAEGYSAIRANRGESDARVRQAKRLLDEHLDRKRVADASARSGRAP